MPFQFAADAGPTASQNVAETHDTLKLAPGMVWTFHDFPFHISAMLAPVVPVPSVNEPTASQKVSDTHDTDLSELAVAPGGVTASWSAQE